MYINQIMDGLRNMTILWPNPLFISPTDIVDTRQWLELAEPPDTLARLDV